MKIAVEGCAHGELDNIYDTIKEIEYKDGITVDLLICCGDFQSSRNEQDLKCMAVPDKYHAICSFYKFPKNEDKRKLWLSLLGTEHMPGKNAILCSNHFEADAFYITKNEKKCLKPQSLPKMIPVPVLESERYYNGEKKAPVLTVFIGGNHEASNYLQELPYGGWVAPNIYYLGYAGVINVAGLRIAGISGIYKGRDFLKGHYEKAPYDENTKRSIYHIRNLEVFRLKQLSQPIDIFLSHDWPTGITNFGNVKQLLKRKPFFEEDINSGNLGSKPCEELLHLLKPKYWFAAHLHCKFAALVKHPNESSTKFLALDKCLPRRKFLQVLEIPHEEEKPIEINYDLEWLTILSLTNHLLTVKNIANYMPGPGSLERYEFTPTEEEKNLVLTKLNNQLKIPDNFRPTALSYQTNSPLKKSKNVKQPEAKLNPQTVELCEILNIQDPICLISESQGLNISLDESFLENSTFINDTDIEFLDNSESVVDLNVSGQENKLTKMTLPDPKVSSNQEEFDDLVDQEKQQKIIESISDITTSITDNGNRQVDSEENGSNQNNVEDVDVLIESEVIETICLNENNENSFSPKRTLGESEQTILTAENASKSSESTPTSKKFKRRNADIYVNAES